MQAAILIGPAQRMKSRLLPAVFQIVAQQQRHVEKNLLGFRFRYAVLIVLPGVSFVPVESDVEHGRPLYMSTIYRYQILLQVNRREYGVARRAGGPHLDSEMWETTNLTSPP